MTVTPPAIPFTFPVVSTPRGVVAALLPSSTTSMPEPSFTTTAPLAATMATQFEPVPSLIVSVLPEFVEWTVTVSLPFPPSRTTAPLRLERSTVSLPLLIVIVVDPPIVDVTANVSLPEPSPSDREWIPEYAMPPEPRPRPERAEDVSVPDRTSASLRPSTVSVSRPRPLMVSAPWNGVRIFPVEATPTVFATVPVPAFTIVGPAVDWTTTVLFPTPAVTVVVIVEGVETIVKTLPLPPSVIVSAVTLL